MHPKLGALLFLSLSPAALAAPIQWPISSGGNGHYYERIDQTALTFAQATSAAASRFFAGATGRLLILETSSYADEFNFVFDNVYVPGVVATRVYWIGAFLPAGGTWRWLNGAPIPASAGWSIDHVEGPGDEGACFFNPNSRNIWDYITSNSTNLVSGYIVEYAASCPADLNSDGIVDDADFTIFVAAYNILDCADPAMPPNCPADLNTDAIVDDADFVLFAAAYNELICP